MGEKYINAFTDFGFKRIFGTEPNKDLLIDFLNQLFLPENKKIVSLTYLPGERLGQVAGDRSGVFDIYCETEKGEKLIVEMQKARQDFFKDRSVFYSTFPIQDQAIRGELNFKLNAVYTVGILGFNFAEHADDAKYFHHEVKLMDTKRKTVFFDKLTYIYLELPKFNKTEDELENDFDRWLYVLKNLHMFDNRPAKIENRIFKKLFEVAKIAAFTNDEKMAYETSLKHLRDLNNVIDTARREGVEEGRAEGKTENKIEIALKMLKDGLSSEMVAKYTGLTIEEVQALSNKNLLCEPKAQYESEKPRKKAKAK
jgi:predicted transposase/invertase (TIGR01784 family)